MAKVSARVQLDERPRKDDDVPRTSGPLPDFGRDSVAPAGTLITLRLTGVAEAAVAEVELDVALRRYAGPGTTGNVTTLLTNACCAMVS